VSQPSAIMGVLQLPFGSTQPLFTRAASAWWMREGEALDRRVAKDLYVSTLFFGRRSFVERSCGQWWILSAEHGLVHPDEVLGPYDVTLKDASA